MGIFDRLMRLVLGRTESWYYHQRTGKMRRWSHGAWEYREPSADEADDAYMWWAIK